MKILNRLGEQEINILMISGDYEAMDYFLRSHASSTEGRRSTELMEKDPKDGFIINMPSDSSTAVDMLNTYFKVMGYRLNIAHKKKPKVNTEVAYCDMPELPKYITSMVKIKRSI